jgi:rsbT co-antagonist protein RsbR
MMDREHGVAELHRFYELSMDMLGIAGFDGYFLNLSQAWEQTLGFTREELLSTPYLEFVHPEDRAQTIARAEEVTVGKVAICFENRYRSHDGSYRWLEWNATPYVREKLIYFVARDVTERKRLEQAQREADEVRNALTERLLAQASALKEQAELLRLIQGHLPLCVWAIDRQGIFTHHAGRGLAAAGMRDGQYLGMNIFELYNSVDCMAPVHKALAGEFGHSHTEDHGVCWENWYIPVREDRGEVTSVVGLSIDVTVTRRVENELRAKLALIERQQRVINELSTPIIEVWDNVLTLPMLGVVDSVRTAEVMQNLLTRIVEKRARFAILDLTGVEAVDTATADHLFKLINAIRLLGAEGIITGIQPSVAQTMVSLGIDLGRIVTLASLRDGLQYSMIAMNRDADRRARAEVGATARGARGA